MANNGGSAAAPTRVPCPSPASEPPAREERQSPRVARWRRDTAGRYRGLDADGYTICHIHRNPVNGRWRVLEIEDRGYLTLAAAKNHASRWAESK